MKKNILILVAFLMIFSFGCYQNKEIKNLQNQPVVLDSKKSEEKTESKLVENIQPQSKNYFPKPDKIVVYKDAKTQTLVESDKLFSDIYVNMNGRVTNPGKLGTADLAFTIDDMKALKKNQTVVEFVYSKGANITVYSKTAEVYGLIFPLTGKEFDKCFLDRHLNHYSGPIGSLDNIGDVLGLLK